MRRSAWLLAAGLGVVLALANHDADQQLSEATHEQASGTSSGTLAAGLGVGPARVNDDNLPRVTPGQVYTHTNVENGESTTATIKVKATKPNTEFDVTINSGLFTRTVDANVIKTVTPPVVVQTVTGAGVSFVQTDPWDMQKIHAYLPHVASSTETNAVVKTITEPTFFYPTLTGTRPTVTEMPPPCKGRSRKCLMRQCMHEYTKPIHITTAWPAQYTNPEGHVARGYITSVTYLSGRPHWGTSSINGIYYPMAYNTTTTSSGCLAVTATRMTHPEQVPWPATEPWDYNLVSGALAKSDVATREPKAFGDPLCWNHHTCHQFCAWTLDQAEAENRKTHKVKWVILGCIIGVIILSFSICGVLGFLKKRRNKTEREGDSVMGGNAVNPVTGTVNPATGGDAVNASSAVGSATTAAASRPEGSNAGTLGRQAEEGRGHVPFAGGPTAAGAGAGAGVAGGLAGEKAAGGEKSGATGGGKGDAEGTGATEEGKSAAVASEKVVEQPAQHVEHVTPVAVHDGADSRRTGSEIVDKGSIRGRHPNRKHDQGFI